jgi:hypothetical protein
VLAYHDLTILPQGGARTLATQELLVREKRSKTMNSKHVTHPPNVLFSRAMDIAPYPVIWPENETQPERRRLARARLYLFAGYVLATADRLNVPLRWGGNWDGDDFDLFDQKFNDLVHFELEE